MAASRLDVRFRHPILQFRTHANCSVLTRLCSNKYTEEYGSPHTNGCRIFWATRERTMPYIVNVSLLVLGLITSACVSNTPIYTSASYSTLPPPTSRVFVTGNKTTVLATTATWLQERGIYPIGHNGQHDAGRVSAAVPCDEPCETRSALEAARTADAEYLILFNVSTRHAPERFSIVITGLATKSGEEIFHAEGTQLLGSEWMHPDDKNEALDHIVCHALATVWRYRPGGYSSDRSDHYCRLPGPNS